MYLVIPCSTLFLQNSTDDLPVDFIKTVQLGLQDTFMYITKFFSSHLYFLQTHAHLAHWPYHHDGNLTK